MRGSRRGIFGGTRCAAIFVVLATMLAHGSAEAINLEPGQKAPDFTVGTLGRGSVSLHDYQGEVTMVTFWSSWCSRCREELLFLKKMEAKYPSVKFLAVNCETENPRAEDIARMQKAVEEWELPFVTGVDEGLKVWDLYKINALPTSMIIGPDGEVLFIQANFVLESPEVIDNALQSACAPVTTAQMKAIEAGE